MKATMTIRIPTELHKQLKEQAKEQGLTLNGLVVQMLWKILEGRH